MESENYKIVKSFISEDERKSVVDWVDSLNQSGQASNKHMERLAESLKGKALMFNQSKNELTNYISNFQAISDVNTDEVPKFILDIQSRIANHFNFPMDNIFFQAVDMPKSGSIGVHYDASLTGFVNYKCNLSILSDDYNFYIDKETLGISQGDLYGFEASLYKHWTDEFKSRRVFLSFGFILPYHILNRESDEPRVRLSQRIEKYFQNLI
jgi:hypothetical protein